MFQRYISAPAGSTRYVVEFTVISVPTAAPLCPVVADIALSTFAGLATFLATFAKIATFSLPFAGGVVLFPSEGFFADGQPAFEDPIWVNVGDEGVTIYPLVLTPLVAKPTLPL